MTPIDQLDFDTRKLLAHTTTVAAVVHGAHVAETAKELMAQVAKQPEALVPRSDLMQVYALLMIGFGRAALYAADDTSGATLLRALRAIRAEVDAILAETEIDLRQIVTIETRVSAALANIAGARPYEVEIRTGRLLHVVLRRSGLNEVVDHIRVDLARDGTVLVHSAGNNPTRATALVPQLQRCLIDILCPVQAIGLRALDIGLEVQEPATAIGIDLYDAEGALRGEVRISRHRDQITSITSNHDQLTALAREYGIEPTMLAVAAKVEQDRL